ncbi:hypothetical protein AC579_1084 [Pseudocercospora musae]|uniref:PD-(D/E)XK nuclease-like domain-containing protein n=1 Tax=Pseudocercospora musae TaxID=113226 RepID=A0A139H850_9PEZI|nr:hypothetical protein AC579_1084 [Pseudocercospora musae]
MWNVPVWIDEVAAHVYEHEHEHECPSQKRKRKRRSLAEIHHNAMPSQSRSISPRKKRKAGSGPENDVAVAVEEAMDVDMAVAYEQYETPTPRAPRQSIINAAGNSNAISSANLFEASERFFHPANLTTQTPTPSSPSARLSRTSSSTRSSPSRARSPIKDATSLELADIPIFQRLRRRTIIPVCVEPLLKELRRIAEDELPWPKEVTRDMEAYAEDLTATIERNVTQDPAPSDWSEWKHVCKRAEIQATEGAPEPSWNEEVHSEVFRRALCSREERIRHFNITTSRPVVEFLPTVGTISSESRLVDYSINYLPSEEERADISRLLRLRSPGLDTVNQTTTERVRHRPCFISIETKRHAETESAKIQLSIWGYAHFRRIQTLFDSRDEGKLNDMLYIHPTIIVHRHDWSLFLLAARRSQPEHLPAGETAGRGGPSRRSAGAIEKIEMIDLNLRLGGTDTLRQIWKLRANLMELAKWGEETYWPIWKQHLQQELVGI